LAKAIERYELDRGAAFSTYATYWVRSTIKNAVAKNGYTVTLPCHIYELTGKIIEAEYESISLFNRSDYQWVANKVGITLLTYVEVKKIDYNFLELLLPDKIGVKEEENSSIDLDEIDPDNHPYLHNFDFFYPERRLLRKSLIQILDECLSQLSDRERNIIKHRYGWHGKQPKTLEELSKMYGLSRERIRQIENKGLQQLRIKLLMKRLKYEDLLL